MTIPIFSISLILLVGVLLFASYKFIPGWNEREFSVKGANWKRVLTLSSALAIITSSIAYAATFNGPVALSIGLVGYIAALATYTDLKVYKIPSDISIVSYWIPVPFLLLCFSSIDLFGPIAWGVMVIVFLLMAMYTKGMGLADIRLMILFLTAFSWWMDPMLMIYALLIAVIVQIVVHIVAPFIKLGVMKKKGANTVWNAETKTLEGSEPTKRRKPQIHIKLLAKVLPARWTASLNRNRPRFHVPFGPALILSYLGAALYYALTANYLPVIYFFWQ